MFDIVDNATGEPITAGEAVERFAIDRPDTDDDEWVDPYEAASWALCPDGSLIILWGEGTTREVLRPPQGKVHIQLGLTPTDPVDAEWPSSKPPPPVSVPPPRMMCPSDTLDVTWDMTPEVGAWMKENARSAIFAASLPLVLNETLSRVPGAPVIGLIPRDWSRRGGLCRLHIRFVMPRTATAFSFVGLYLVDQHDTPLAWMADTQGAPVLLAGDHVVRGLVLNFPSPPA